jgi:hypothetical protein
MNSSDLNKLHIKGIDYYDSIGLTIYYNNFCIYIQSYNRPNYMRLKNGSWKYVEYKDSFNEILHYGIYDGKTILMNIIYE